MTRTAHRIALAWLILILGIAGLAWAQAPAATSAPAHTNDECLLCHGEPSAARADGTSVAVDSGRFGGSVHGQILGCVDCHADVATAELPHPEQLAPVDCGICHGDAKEAYDRSVHAAAKQAGKADAATCVSCHGSHEIRSSRDPESRTYHLNVASLCATCHDGQRTALGASQAASIAGQFEDSIHGRALTRRGLIVAPNCATCHGFHDVLAPENPESRIFRRNVPDTCGTCHEGIEHQYNRGIHGTLVAAGHPRAPVCIDCHSAHQIGEVQAPGYRLDAIQECGTCHEEALRTYRDTFHGQVTALGFERTATCADCHGAHELHPKEDPRSRVSAARRLETCQTCHPSATANFAAYDPHADPHDRDRNPPLYYTARFMEALLVGVFGFFGLHSTLWFARSWRERRRGASPPPAPPSAAQEPSPASSPGEPAGDHPASDGPQA